MIADGKAGKTRIDVHVKGPMSGSFFGGSVAREIGVERQLAQTQATRPVDGVAQRLRMQGKRQKNGENDLHDVLLLSMHRRSSAFRTPPGRFREPRRRQNGEG